MQHKNTKQRRIISETDRNCPLNIRWTFLHLCCFLQLWAVTRTAMDDDLWGLALFFLHSLFGLCNINLLPISVGAGCKGRWQTRHNCWESWRASAKLPDSAIRTLRGGREKNLTMLPKNCLPVIVTAIRAAGGHPWHVTYPELLKLTPPKIPKRKGVWGWGKPSYKVSVYKTLMSGCGL